MNFMLGFVKYDFQNEIENVHLLKVLCLIILELFITVNIQVMLDRDWIMFK